MDKQQNNNYNNYQNIDYSQMSEAEREAQFRRQHQQYISEKMARKKQAFRLRKAQFGSSSSDDSDEDDQAPSDSSKSDQPKKQKLMQKEDKQIKILKSNPKKDEDPFQKIPVNSQKKGGQWVKDVLALHQTSIAIQNTTFDIRSFTKIKIISQVTMGYPYRIKISQQNSEILFSPSVGITEQKNGLLVNYYIFARIIQDKLLLSGIKLKQPKQQKIPAVPQSLIANTFMHGRIYKKSQVLGKWEERFIVVNKEGIFSYKKFNEKYTMNIPSGSIKELWTRFQVQDELLIVKIIYNSTKTQFGFPLCEVLNKNCWLFSFFAVMNRK